jgi:SAM-dependent methyltransferase
MALDRFTDGDADERYIGRWSDPLAEQFVGWLAVPAGAAWVDVGCGTGRLSAQIVATASPATLLGVDPSRAFVGDGNPAQAPRPRRDTGRRGLERDGRRSS